MPHAWAYIANLCICRSVAKQCRTLCDLQHSSSPSSSPRVCPSSCPLNQWCQPTISFFATLFSFCLQSFPALVSFPMSWLLASDGQNTGASASAWTSPSNEYSALISFRIDWLISLLSKGFSRVFPNTTVWKHQFFSGLPSLWSYSHIQTWLLERS